MESNKFDPAASVYLLREVRLRDADRARMRPDPMQGLRFCPSSDAHSLMTCSKWPSAAAVDIGRPQVGVVSNTELRETAVTGRPHAGR